MSAQAPVDLHRDGADAFSGGRERAVNTSLVLIGLAISTEVLLVLPVVGALSNLLVGAALVICVVAIAMGTKVARPRPSMSWLTVFVAYAGASYFWSEDPSITVVKFITYIQLLLMAVVISVLATSTRRFSFVLGGYVLGAVIVAGTVIANFLMGNPSARDPVMARFAAGFANPNRTSAILVVGIAIGTFLIVTGVRPRGLWIGFIVAAPFAVLLTGSRSGLLALILTGIMSVVWLGVGYPRHAKGLAVISVAVLAVVMFVPKASLQRATDFSGSSHGTRSVDLRRTALETGLEAMAETPVSGSGAGTFPLRMEAREEKGMVAHNSIVSVGVELGAIGVLLLSAAVFVAWRAASARGGMLRWLALTIGVALGTMALFASFEDDKVSWFVIAIVSVLAVQELSISDTQQDPVSDGGVSLVGSVDEVPTPVDPSVVL